jgi:tetratricopeptide (TPR) repeat protein
VETSREEGVAACRRALDLGLAPRRAALVRRTLALKLIRLERPAEALEVYRDAARAQPDDADAQFRLGQALLSMADDASGAAEALARARDLRPDDARTQGALGLALAALGRTAEAVAAFEVAERLDARFFESRPASRLAYEAARRGERWP